MAGPDFPNVPKAEGVPPVKRDASNPGDTPTQALDGDTITVNGFGTDTWGVYTDGNAKALEPDTIVSVGYQAEHRVADYPIEQGGFETYDKVELPFEVMVVMTKGGSWEERRAFVSAVEEIRGDTKLYLVVTPEKTYRNVNITRVSIDRSREQGAGLITVEMHLREVRENATASFSNSKEAASADTVNNGSVQAQDATASDVAAVATKSNSVASTLAGGKSFFSGAAGQLLKAVPLAAGIASQATTVQLAQRAVGIVLSQKRTGLFADINVDNTPAALGVLVRDGVPLLKSAGVDLPGNLAIFDMHGSSDPAFTGLGDRFRMFWAG